MLIEELEVCAKEDDSDRFRNRFDHFRMAKRINCLPKVTSKLPNPRWVWPKFSESRPNLRDFAGC